MNDAPDRSDDAPDISNDAPDHFDGVLSGPHAGREAPRGEAGRSRDLPASLAAGVP